MPCLLPRNESIEKEPDAPRACVAEANVGLPKVVENEADPKLSVGF